MSLPCDRRTERQHLADLNRELGDEPATDAVDLVVGLLASVVFWSVVALVITA